MSGPDDYLRVAAQLEGLRDCERPRRVGEDAALGDRSSVLHQRPAYQVMDTDPPCVIVRQIAYGHTDPNDPDRKPWSGARRGGQGIVWLMAF